MSISMNALSSSPSLTAVNRNPADIGILQNMESQERGYNQGIRNGQDGENVIRTVDGALKSISDSLQRMRDLSLRASSSALYTDDDRAMMQQEIDQLKEHITDVSKNTNFNTKKLLDGSMADMHLALNPEGGGLEIRTEDATLEALGLADYNITGSFDLSAVDKALEKISGARASLGAQSNALGHSISVAETTSLNMTAAASSRRDLDIPKYISDREKKNVMDQYRYFVINQKKNQKASLVDRMFM